MHHCISVIGFCVGCACSRISLPRQKPCQSSLWMRTPPPSMFVHANSHCEKLHLSGLILSHTNHRVAGVRLLQNQFAPHRTTREKSIHGKGSNGLSSPVIAPHSRLHNSPSFCFARTVGVSKLRPMP